MVRAGARVVPNPPGCLPADKWHDDVEYVPLAASRGNDRAHRMMSDGVFAVVLLVVALLANACRNWWRDGDWTRS